MAKKLHWRTVAKREIEKWEQSLKQAGRKNRWGVSKKEYIKKHGSDSWTIEEKRRRGLEKFWKSRRDAKRYQIEKLKDKLSPSRVKERKNRRRLKKRRKNS